MTRRTASTVSSHDRPMSWNRGSPPKVFWMSLIAGISATARPTPGGPEIEQDELAPLIAEPEPIALPLADDPLDVEVRGRVADLEREELAVIAPRSSGWSGRPAGPRARRDRARNQPIRVSTPWAGTVGRPDPESILARRDVLDAEPAVLVEVRDELRLAGRIRGSPPAGSSSSRRASPARRRGRSGRSRRGPGRRPAPGPSGRA